MSTKLFSSVKVISFIIDAVGYVFFNASPCNNFPFNFTKQPKLNSRKNIDIYSFSFSFSISLPNFCLSLSCICLDSDANGNCRNPNPPFLSLLLDRVRIMAKAEGGKEPINEQAVANMYAAMRSELNQIYSKITELEMEVSEHTLVTNAIQPLDQSRRCYRMIGGVLVERTIKEVLPAVQRNKEGLEEVVARLNEALEKKKKEISEFEANYKIRIRKADAEVKDESGRKEGSAQGVLVGPAGGSE
ncbi:putative prefoldin subunit 2 [Glycine max]|nr:putative prefoldin subunit 2 [Glycine max]